MTTRSHRTARSRRELPLAAVVCALLVVVGAWLVSWWIVPAAAMIAAVLWWDRPHIAIEVMWGAVAGWIVLLLIDSLRGRFEARDTYGDTGHGY